MISSFDNPRVKWMRSLHEVRGRRAEGCFVVEGALIEDALASGLKPRLVFYESRTMQSSRRSRSLLDLMAGLPSEEVTPAVLAAVCDTVTPQGAIAAFPLPAHVQTIPSTGMVVVLDGLRDPGNAGTILRSAEAAGCTAVLATPDSVDFYSPKVVRAGMGAHFRLPLLPDVSWAMLGAVLGDRAIYLAEASGEMPYYLVDWTMPSALVVGNETEGPRPDARRCAAGRVSIPMPGRAESLNAGVAASIIIFESVRQRYMPSHKGD